MGVDSSCGTWVLPAKSSALDACRKRTCSPVCSCRSRTPCSSAATATPLTSAVSTGCSQDSATEEMPARL